MVQDDAVTAFGLPVRAAGARRHRQLDVAGLARPGAHHEVDPVTCVRLEPDADPRELAAGELLDDRLRDALAVDRELEDLPLPPER